MTALGLVRGEVLCAALVLCVSCSKKDAIQTKQIYVCGLKCSRLLIRISCDRPCHATVAPYLSQTWLLNEGTWCHLPCQR
jgi:hypothetical protein